MLSCVGPQHASYGSKDYCHEDRTPSWCFLCSFLKCIIDCIACGSGEACSHNSLEGEKKYVIKNNKEILASTFCNTFGPVLAQEGLIPS